MKLNAKDISVTDVVWATFAGCDGSGPFVHIKGGEVVATGEGGSVVIRTGNGQLETFHNWGIYSLHATEAQAWEAAADRLQRRSDEIVAKVIECRTRAAGKPQEVATN
jgi:hypothetical protein